MIRILLSFLFLFDLPPLIAFSSTDARELHVGDRVHVSVTVYSTSPDPLSLNVSFLDTPGFIMVDIPQFGAGHVWQDHPVIVEVVYLVTEDAKAFSNIDVVAYAGTESAATSVGVRVRGVPPPPSPIWLPIVMAGGVGETP